MQTPVNSELKKTSKVMAWLAIASLLLVLTWLFDFLGARSAVQPLRVSGNTVIIPADRQGHYRAEGEINGKAVEFLLDTGATAVAIPEKLAEQLGLEKGQQIQLQTANGIALGYMTRLDQVSLGSIRVNNVRAVISPGLGGDTLLGMSFLRHLSWRHANNELILEVEPQSPGIGAEE
ncbi:MAG: retroviral-like aspartic protease family protein [Xanthomonadales bacterium]|nr:retroviral-like aspartic protease family protein [Xanthomonadales bacterium]